MFKKKQVRKAVGKIPNLSLMQRIMLAEKLKKDKALLKIHQKREKKAKK